MLAEEEDCAENAEECYDEAFEAACPEENDEDLYDEEGYDEDLYEEEQECDVHTEEGEYQECDEELLDELLNECDEAEVALTESATTEEELDETITNCYQDAMESACE